jgi:hypothetical protein
MVRGTHCSDMVQKCMKDLCKLKRPNAIPYNQKNDIRPFEVSEVVLDWILDPDSVSGRDIN